MLVWYVSCLIARPYPLFDFQAPERVFGRDALTRSVPHYLFRNVPRNTARRFRTHCIHISAHCHIHATAHINTKNTRCSPLQAAYVRLCTEHTGCNTQRNTRDLLRDSCGAQAAQAASDLTSGLTSMSGLASGLASITDPLESPLGCGVFEVSGLSSETARKARRRLTSYR